MSSKDDSIMTTVVGSDGKERLVRKDSAQIEALGALDELNNYIGVLKCTAKDDTGYLWHWSTAIQREIFAINATIAGIDTPFSKHAFSNMEKAFGIMTEKLHPSNGFLYPAPTMLSAHCHYVCSLARRAERRLVALDKEEPVRPDILTFVNQLSDYFFLLARYVAFRAGFRHSYWKGGQTHTPKHKRSRLRDKKEA